MKRSTLLLLVLLPLRLLAQGYFVFENIDVIPGPALVSISAVPGTFNPANGPPGAYVGSDYAASLYYLIGILTDQALFDSSNPILVGSADTPFYGTTGFNPANWAGLFAGGAVYLPTMGTVTVQVRAWYSGGGQYTSYAQALAAGQNVGESNPVAVDLAYGLGNPPVPDGWLPFTVGIVPEPSTLGLIVAGGMSFWLCRRKYPGPFVRRLPTRGVDDSTSGKC
jgi:hypothetical protein